MLDLFKSLRRGALVLAAGAVLALSATAVAHAGGHHHHKGHHHHGHHHNGQHHFWRFRHLYAGGYGRCSYWRNECGSRWGYGTYAYGRCLWRNGC